MKYGYARVSTDDQNSDLQHQALKRAGCRKVFVDDGISGIGANRPALRSCMKTLNKGDTLIVWKLDRLARSLAELIRIVDDLQNRHIQLRSITEEINTSTPGGRLTFHLFGALAEFERNLIIERTRAGVSAARSRGVKFGRKRKLSVQQIEQAKKLIATGERPADVAASFSVGRATLYRAIHPITNLQRGNT